MITDLVLANDLLNLATVFRLSDTVSVEFRDYAGPKGAWLIFDWSDDPPRYGVYGNGDPNVGFELVEVAIARGLDLVEVLTKQKQKLGEVVQFPLAKPLSEYQNRTQK